MDKIPLSTKFFAPSPKDSLVVRKKLMERLDQGMEAKVTLVCAPAGFGKTSLVSSWKAQSTLDIAWLTLDERDNDPCRFLFYLANALQKIDGEIGASALPMLDIPYSVQTEGFLEVCINDIAQLESRAVLVLDEFESVTDARINDILSFFISNLPPQLHLVIISRRELGFPVSRMRLNGELTEILTRDLRFSQDEIASFFKTTLPIELQLDELQALCRRTEGWVAGLQLAGLSLKVHTNISEFINSFAGKDFYVAEYLVGEVLGSQPDIIQEFILSISILDRFNASLCSAVSGQPDVGKTLDYLERENLFLIRQDRQGHWFRFHTLFRDLLRDQLDKVAGEDEIRNLHKRAADWFAWRGLHGQALKHSTEAGELAIAADFVESSAMNMIGQGQFRELRELIESIPDAEYEQRPLLMLCNAWLYTFTGEKVPVEETLATVEQLLKDCSADVVKQAKGHIASLRCMTCRRNGAIEETESYAMEAIGALGTDEHLARATTYYNLGVSSFNKGQILTASEWLQDALAESQQGDIWYASYVIKSRIAEYHIARGQLRLSETICREAIEHAVRCGDKKLLLLTGSLHAALGRFFYERNQLDLADEHLNRAIEMGEQLGDKTEVRRALRFLSFSLYRKQGLSVALEGAQRARGLALRTDDQLSISEIEATEARLWLINASSSSLPSDDLVAVKQWADKYRAESEKNSVEGEFFSQLTLVWFELFKGMHQESLARVQRVKNVATKVGRINSLIHALALEALILKKSGDSRSALKSITQSLRLAKPEGYCRVFVDHGISMMELLVDARESGVSREYTESLISAIDNELPEEARLVMKEKKSRSALAPASSEKLSVDTKLELFEQLNDREVGILKLVEAGLRNEEIAEEKYISLHTVKWHLANAYRKLGVSKRTKAVARCRELGILS